MGQTYLQAKNIETLEYDMSKAHIVATIMCQFIEHMSINKTSHGDQFVVTYSLKKVINKWGDIAKESTKSEMKQLHD